jgi:hypothetical protein
VASSHSLLKIIETLKRDWEHTVERTVFEGPSCQKTEAVCGIIATGIADVLIISTAAGSSPLEGKAERAVWGLAEKPMANLILPIIDQMAGKKKKK